MKMLAMLSLLLFTSLAHAEDFGVGIILGDPTGLSAKMKLDGSHSLDGALAFSSGKRTGAQFHADYLWDRARSWGTTQGPLDMYYGLGGRLVSYEDDDDKSKLSIGPRGSIGLNFNINNPNIEFFGEVAAILEIAPSMAADLDVGVGARVRF
ncbi:hypothetical protein [Bdellovibrio sp. HCB337]|uniref:hypothetical protein n=1 Tax=Bdellovibrio sp. HCB337 TaxID=3394358 RepID=UPI0039A541D0